MYLCYVNSERAVLCAGTLYVCDGSGHTGFGGVRLGLKTPVAVLCVSGRGLYFVGMETRNRMHFFVFCISGARFGAYGVSSSQTRAGERTAVRRRLLFIALVWCPIVQRYNRVFRHLRDSMVRCR